jgi:methylthioxylose transferase
MEQRPAGAPLSVSAARKNDALILLSLLGALGAIFWVISNRPIGVTGEWTWPTRTVIGANLPVALTGVALLIAAAGWLTRVKRWEKTSRRGRAAWLVALVLLAWLLALGILQMPDQPGYVAGGIIAGPQTTSYFTAALNMTHLAVAIKEFPLHMQSTNQLIHVRTHPPGPIVFFWSINRLMESSPGLQRITERLYRLSDRQDISALTEYVTRDLGFPFTRANSLAAVASAALLPLFGSLFLLPLYWLGRRLFDPDTALRGCLLATVIPAFLLFAPAIDQLVLLFAVLIMASFPPLLKRGNPVIGLAFALGVFISLGLMILPLFLGLWWLLDSRAGKNLRLAPPRKLALGIIGGAAIFLAFYGLLRLILGFDFPQVVKIGLSAHREITLHEAARTYWKWVLYNPVEFAFFLGVPISLWALAGLRGGFALGWIASLLLLNFSGTVLGETGRIWLFLMPPAALIAAARLGQLGKRFDLGFFTALVLQIGQALVMKVGLDLFIIK